MRSALGESMHDEAGTVRSLTLERPAVPASVRELRAALVDFARACGASAPVLDAVALAVTEATTNVVRHAYGDQAADPGPIDVSASAVGGELIVTVADRGDGLRAGRASPGLGLGLALIARSADRIDLRTSGDGGVEIRMAFALSR